MSARLEGERWAGDCECRHSHDAHSHFTTSEHCSERDCTCEDYHRTLWHWLLDKIGRP